MKKVAYNILPGTEEILKTMGSRLSLPDSDEAYLQS